MNTDQSQQESQPKPQQSKSSLSGYILILLIAVMTSVLSLAIYDHYRYHPIITVDIDAIMKNKMEEIRLSEGQYHKDEMVKKSKRWAHDLANIIRALQQQYHAIVLVRPAVVEGATDMTNQISQQLDQQK